MSGKVAKFRVTVTPGWADDITAETPVTGDVPLARAVTGMTTPSPGSMKPLPLPGPPAMQDSTFVADSKPMDGPHCCDGYVKVRLQAVSVPVSREAVSCTRRVHVPIAFVPLTAA